MRSKQRVFAFDTAEQAWSFINVASTAGYAAYDGIKPTVNESVGNKYIVQIPRQYTQFTSDLSQICRSVKSSTSNSVNEHVFCFDKFMEGTVLQESKVQVQEDDEPMRRRAARHQELPQNRIRMVHSA